LPDGTDQPGATDPGTPEEQIHNTVATTRLFETISQTMAPVMGLLGTDAPAVPTGGGGGGGTYLFASIEELDGVIGQWQDLVDEIRSDLHEIKAAGHHAATPAGDTVSNDNFRESADVVKAMQKHNEQLLVYAQHYVVKLQECRTQMATTEQGNQTRMNQVH
jgi:hypothetical protein